MSSDIILANELYIEYNGVQIACTTDFTLTLDKESINIICSAWQKNAGASKSWIIDFTAIVKRSDANGYLKFSDLFVSLNDSNEPVNVALKSTILTDNYYTGRALLSNVTKTGAQDEVVTYSGTLSSYGPLSILTGTNNVLPYTLPFTLP